MCHYAVRWTKQHSGTGVHRPRLREGAVLGARVDWRSTVDATKDLLSHVIIRKWRAGMQAGERGEHSFDLSKQDCFLFPQQSKSPSQHAVRGN